MPGVDPVPGWLHVSKTDNGGEIATEVERLRWIGADVEAWPTERVREVLPNQRYFGALHFPARLPHPSAQLRARACRRRRKMPACASSRTRRRSPIDPAGVRKRIDTPEARVRAPHVVLAGNVQLGELMPRLAATLLPITTFVMVTEPIPRLSEIVRYRGAVSDSNRADNHYRIVGGEIGDAVVRTHAGLASRSALGAARARRRHRAQFSRSRQGRDRASVERHARARDPSHAADRRDREPGVWVASGFGGHGLNTTAMGGELIARGIVESDADLAAVCALRTGVGGRRARPGAGARHLLGQAAGRADRAGRVALSRAMAQPPSGAAGLRSRA